MNNNEDKTITGFIKEKDKAEETLNIYIEKMKSKDVFDFKFATADKQGNLSININGVKVRLDNIDIKGKIYEPRYRLMALSKTYKVVVKSVDKENKEVFVSHRKARSITREKLIKEIDNAIKNKEQIEVLAIVDYVKESNNYCLIDIGGVGIRGKIKVGEWSSTYTSNYKRAAKHGDIIRVVVMSSGMFDGKVTFDCSRKAALDENLWKGIEERMAKDTAVNVTCMIKAANNFWGEIEGLDEINVYCEYPDADKNLFIAEGITYQGYVSAVSEETKLLRVRVHKVLDK